MAVSIPSNKGLLGFIFLFQTSPLFTRLFFNNDLTYPGVTKPPTRPQYPLGDNGSPVVTGEAASFAIVKEAP